MFPCMLSVHKDGWMDGWICGLPVPERLDGFSALSSLFGVLLYLAKPSCFGSHSRFLYSDSSPGILLL